MEEAKCDIHEVVTDRAHRIGKRYVEKKNRKKLSKNIIVTFYRTKSKLKNDVKVKLDLAKSRYTIFTKAIETAKQSNVVD